MCCYNQVVVVTRTFSTETIESVPAMCVVVKIEVDGVNSDFLTKFDCNGGGHAVEQEHWATLTVHK